MIYLLLRFANALKYMYCCEISLLQKNAKKYETISNGQAIRAIWNRNNRIHVSVTIKRRSISILCSLQ